MKHYIEFVNELMTVADADGNGYDAYEVDPDEPWDTVEALARFGRQYDLDPVLALGELRRHLKHCR
jgi:hypothetical protein